MSAAAGPTIGLGTTMIEPGFTGGRLDGIGVYTQALMRHLPQAGCAVRPYSWLLQRDAATVRVGQLFPQSFAWSSLRRAFH